MAMKNEKNIINNEHRGNGLTPFSSDISSFAAKLLGKQGLMEMKIITSWENIVGPELAQFSIPEKISFKKDERSNGVLHLIVSNGAFALEIGHKNSLILEKVNTFFGYNAVSQIKIFQNESYFCNNSTSKHEDKKDKKLVSSDEKTYIKQITEEIQDPELKARLQSLGENIFKQNK